MNKKQRQLLQAGAVVAASLAGNNVATGATIPNRPMETPAPLTAADAVAIDGEVADVDVLLAAMPTNTIPTGQYKKMYGPPKLVYGPPPAPPKEIEKPDTMTAPADSVLLEKRVIAITAQALKTHPRKISRESNFIRDLGADSLDVVEILLDIEHEWNITFTDEAVIKIQTVGDVIDYLWQAVRKTEE